MDTVMQDTPLKSNPLNIVNGFRYVPGDHYLENVTFKQLKDFKRFYAQQVAEDPYAPGVRDRAMIKLVFNPYSLKLSVSNTQNYFQSYGANETDGGKVRVFPPLSESIVDDPLFLTVLRKDAELMREYCNRMGKDELNLSIHLIRYKSIEGGASYSSPVWLHLDDEPLVFIHLINLTENALGADNVISEMDNKPKHVLRLINPLDTLVVDTMKKHAVTPLGSMGGVAYRDVMLVNLEAEVQQKK